VAKRPSAERKSCDVKSGERAWATGMSMPVNIDCFY
jgi:hypothetical protein